MAAAAIVGAGTRPTAIEGTLRFVDAPEVARTFERAVTLTVTAADLPGLAKPVDRGLGGLGGGNAGGGLLGRLFRR